jgi:hypothetical protein
LKKNGKMEVVIVDVIGGRCEEFVKGKVKWWMEKKKIWIM